MIEKYFHKIARISERNPWYVIGIIVLITAVFIYGMTRIEEDYGYKSMLPEDIESVQALEEVEDIFGGTNEEQVLITAPDVLEGSVLRKVVEYESFLMKNEELGEVFATAVKTPLDNMEYLPEGISPGLPVQENNAYESQNHMQIEEEGFGHAVMTTDDLQPRQSVRLTDAAEELSDSELADQVIRNIEFAKVREQETGIQMAQLNISDDRTALMLIVDLNIDLSTSDMITLAEPFRSNTEEYFESIAGTKVYVNGMATQNMDANKRTMQDTQNLFLLAFIFIIAVLYFTFRRFSDVVLTMLVIIVTLSWVMGFSGWLNFPFTYNSTAIMPLMLGINIAYVIHVMSRYYEERRKGQDPEKSMIQSVATVGVAVFLTALTTAFGFASFGISDMPPVVNFGVLCVTGVLFSFILAITLLPALIIIRDRRVRARDKWDAIYEKRGKKEGNTFIDSVLVRIAVISENHRLVVGAISVVVVTACIIMATRVSTEADMTKMMPEDMPSIIAQEKIHEKFGGQGMAFALVKGDILKPETLKSMLAYEDGVSISDMESAEGEVIFERGRTSSIADLILMTAGGIPDTEEEVAEIIGFMNGTGSETGKIVNEEGTRALIMIRISGSSQKDMERITDHMREQSEFIQNENPSIEIVASGFPAILNDIFKNLIPTQMKTTGLALLLCLIIVSIIFKSVLLGIAATSVVLIAVALELGSLYILGWPLDFMTVMVSSLVIGAGIDFGIHVTHRFVEEWNTDDVSVEEAINRTVAHVGKAVLAAAFTTAGAFGIIAISDIAYLRRFGGITALSLLFALLAALFVLPSILAAVGKYKDKKKESVKAG